MKINVKSWRLIVVGAALLVAIIACSRPGTEQVIYVTATFPGGDRVLQQSPTPSRPTDTPIQPTPNPTVSGSEVVIEDGTYTVQPGDTLAIIAASVGTSVDALQSVNDIENPNLLEVGQVLFIPDANGEVPTGPSYKIIPDSELVYSPAAADFDIAAYMKLKNGFIRAYSDEVGNELLSGVEMISQASEDYSINPRLLIALLEYRGGWLEQSNPTEFAQEYPLGLQAAGRDGLWRQLLDASNALSAGYYGWKYRGLRTLTFADGRSIVIDPSLNAGTVGVQYFLSRGSTLEQWLVDVSEGGFFQTYLTLFGDPFVKAIEPLIPPNLSQPEITFPFAAGETWYYTGGPHGGYNSGSAWASIDFAPPAPPDSVIAEQGFCYTSPFWTTAVAPGVIARSGRGFVVLDLDLDGNEYTGWTIVYLHIKDDEDLIAAGTRVETGDRLGHPSCDGGFSSATHLHIGRRYNGEWIPVDCFDCRVPHAELVMSGWTVRGYENAEYQGYMEDSGDGFRRAEQGRTDPINQITHNG